jgi:DNA-directed RNA polymerase subunit RPC12/RpoP
MATITDAVVRVELTGQIVRADCFGNNAAIECPHCLSYPVLLIARKDQRGTSKKKPATCRQCGAKVHIVDDITANDPFREPLNKSSFRIASKAPVV